MKNINLYYNKKERWQLMFNIVIYFIFAGFTLSLAFNQPTLIEAVPFVMILIFFLSFSLLNDYLNFLFKVAIHQLTIECDPTSTLNTIEKLNKLDIFKSFQLSMFMLKCLAFLDDQKMEDAIQFVDNQSTQLKHKDKVFMSHFVLFKAYGGLNNIKEMKKHYLRLKEIKEITYKGKRVSPLFSFEDIDAFYHLKTKDFKKAWVSLQHSHIKAMNYRELLDHYYLRIMCELELNNLTQAKHFLTCLPEVVKPNKIKETLHKEVENYETSSKRRKSSSSTNS